MDPGCSIDTMLTGHAPGITMGAVVRDHGVKQLKFRSREGKCRDWKVLVTDVKKALKSVATTCGGDGGGECHVLFARHGGTIINVDSMKVSYNVCKTGIVKRAGELTAIDCTGNTYGMEAWVYVGTGTSASEGFVRLVAAP